MGFSDDPSPMETVVRQVLLIFAETLANPKPVTPQLEEIWVRVLELASVPVQDVETTAARMILTEQFFPTPATFLKAWKPPQDDDTAAELAWQKVLDAVRRYGGNASLHVSDFAGDGAAMWALDRMGWDRLCRELDEEKRAIWRAEFARIYRAARQTNARLTYIAGRHERENRLHGHDLRPELVGRPDWPHLPGEPEALPAGFTGLGAILKALPAGPADEEEDVWWE